MRSWKRHDDAIAWDFMKEHTTGWQEYVDEVKAATSPKTSRTSTKIPAAGDPQGRRSVWAEATIKGRERGTGGVMSIWGIGYNQHLHGQHNTISSST